VNKAIDKAFGEIEEIDRLMSNYKEDSEISKANRLRAGERMLISPETFDVIQRAIGFSKLTSGAFDITVEPSLKLWGFFSTGVTHEPRHYEIKKVLELVGYDKILLDEKKGTIGFTKEGVRVDLGGIAKGYAVDKAIEVLKNYGIKNALVKAGGDIFAMGILPTSYGWLIGIQHPRKEAEYLTIMELENKAVSTSGDYERYFIINNKRYSHIIDPRTGYPKSNIPASVTVIAQDSTTADALATAIFVVGPEKGLKLIESIHGVEVMIVSEKRGTLIIDKSKEFDKYLKLKGIESKDASTSNYPGTTVEVTRGTSNFEYPCGRTW
jgi:thiamine biosynthesis lipoprotein